jgi:hypothetical protein
MTTREADLRRVMRSAELSPGARLLAWELSQWASDAEDVCVRSQIQLAADLGVHRNSVFRWIKELQAAGVVTTESCGVMNAYTLHLKAIEAAPR